MSNKLTFTIIGHNEEEHLRQLLPILCQSGDEVIYVDLESNDNSYDYAKEVGCKTSIKTDSNLTDASLVFSRPN